MLLKRLYETPHESYRASRGLFKVLRGKKKGTLNYAAFSHQGIYVSYDQKFLGLQRL